MRRRDFILATGATALDTLSSGAAWTSSDQPPPPIRELPAAPSIRIAAHNSRQADKDRADLVCDGRDDQEEINQALAWRPRDAKNEGCRVLLAAGSYQLRRDPRLPVPTSIGIFRGSTELRGEGPATSLWLEDGQRCSMIRQVADGLSAIVVRDLRLEPNADANRPLAERDWLHQHAVSFQPTWHPLGKRPESAVLPVRCGVERVTVGDVVGIGVLLYGAFPFCRHSHFTGAEHVCAELSEGRGGELAGNTCLLEGPRIAGNVFGTDSHDDATIRDNTTIVRKGARVRGAVHPLSGYRALIANNKIISEGGIIHSAIQARSYHNMISGNTVLGSPGAHPAIEVNGHTMIFANVLQRVDVIRIARGNDWPIRADANLLNAVTFGADIRLGTNLPL